jgi:hypothetical protein
MGARHILKNEKERRCESKANSEEILEWRKKQGKQINKLLLIKPGAATAPFKREEDLKFWGRG